MNRKLLRALFRLARKEDINTQQATAALASVLTQKSITNTPFARKVARLLAPFTLQPEGTPHAYTPEILALFYENALLNRKPSGTFYTPWPLAQLLAQEVLTVFCQKYGFGANSQPEKLSEKTRRKLTTQFTALTVCDPACGTGGLLLPFAVQLAQLLVRLNPSQNEGKFLKHILENNLFGADIDAGALNVFLTRSQLLCAQYGVTLNTKRFCAHFSNADALACENGKSVWQVKFPTVFKKGGFDIILSNPPYVGQKGHKEIFNTLRQNPLWAHYVTPKSDLQYFFFYLAVLLLKPNAIGGFLTPPYFATAAGAYALRQHLKQELSFHRLLNFEQNILFKDASPHTLLSVFERGNINIPCRVGINPIQEIKAENLFQGTNLFLQTHPCDAPINDVLHKLQRAPLTLKEVAHISNGLMTGCDKISAAHIRKFPSENYTKGQGVFVLSYTEKKSLLLTPTEKEKIKPFFKNSDIFPYVPRSQNMLYLIDLFYPNDRQINLKKYPHIFAHLRCFQKVLLARKQNNNGIEHQLAKGNFWFGSVRRKMDFEGEKLVTPQRALYPTFAYTNGPFYASSDVYFITPRKVSAWYLLALLNSRISWLWFFYQGKRKGNLLEFYAQPLADFPVPAATPHAQKKLVQLAQQIYFSKKQNPNADISALQTQIDLLCARLYGLTPVQEKILLAWQPNN